MIEKTKTEFVRFNTVKDYLKEKENMRSNETAVNDLTSRFNSLIVAVIADAAATAKENKRNTILAVDMKEALDKTVGKKHLNAQELLDEIILQNPIGLGSISKGINKYIEDQEKK
jgi:histone H3/H4